MSTQVLSPSQILSERQSTWMREFLIVAMASLLIVFCTPLAIPLPFTPIPLALAPQLCLALGATLGSRRAAAAIFAYLFQGAIGLPVFALGKSGLPHLLGPGGGYLFGFAAGAYVTGYLIERMREKAAYKTFIAMAAGNGVIFFFGALQLSLFLGLKSALLLGVLPFLFGDALKLFLVHKVIAKGLAGGSGWLGMKRLPRILPSEKLD
jgi:biotin transport system substrate-specific component